MYATLLIACCFIQWVSEKQHEYQCHSLQLLYYQAPLSASLLLLVIPVVEPVFNERGAFAPWSYEAVVSVIPGTDIVAPWLYEMW